MENLENFLDRKSLLADKKEVTDELLDYLIELSEEEINFDSIEKFTDKKYRDLTENEKKELITKLENADYKKYKNSFISTSKLLYEKSETLVKEIKALNVLNELGYSVYLLPFGYARNNQNFLQKSTDSIFEHRFLEMKSISSDGKNAGYNAYRESRKQADNVILSFEKDVSPKIALNNVQRSLNISKRTYDENNIQADMSGYVFLHFEKTNETELFEIDKNGRTKKIELNSFGLKNTRESINDSQVEVEVKNESIEQPSANISQNEILSTKKSEGTITGSQVEEKPRTEPRSSPRENITETNSFINQNEKSQVNKTANFENEVKGLVEEDEQKEKINVQCKNNLLINENPYAKKCLLDDINKAKSTGENLYDGITKDNIDVFISYSNDLDDKNIQWAYANDTTNTKNLYFRNLYDTKSFFDENKKVVVEVPDFTETPLTDLYKFAKEVAESDVENSPDIIGKEGNFKKLAEIFKDSEIIQNAYNKTELNEKKLLKSDNSEQNKISNLENQKEFLKTSSENLKNTCEKISQNSPELKKAILNEKLTKDLTSEQLKSIVDASTNLAKAINNLANAIENTNKTGNTR